MCTKSSSLTIQLPNWLRDYCQQYKVSRELSDRMNFVIKASQKNIELHTGGPFAAAVFESDTGKLVALGVNMVSTQKLSILHAEMVALSLAQAKINEFDLSKSDQALELITSTEPCAMCLGAIPWSGVKKLITAAKGSDAEAIGFDEGEKPNNWQQSLEKRGIEVITQICSDDAKRVLESYSKMNGPIY